MTRGDGNQSEAIGFLISSPPKIEHEAERNSLHTLESLFIKCAKSYLPEPARMRSDRVKAPGRSLLFPLMNSLLNLG